jgi:UPF0716 protein FxsA
MFMRLMLLFTVVPIIELYLLVKAGEQIGTLNTIAVVILTGIIGASFARSQGARIIQQIRSTLSQGQVPGTELLQGAMILAGGVLLLTPGFLTDLVGFSLLFPLTRKVYVNFALRYIKKKFKNGQWHVSTYTPPPDSYPGEGNSLNHDDD